MNELCSMYLLQPKWMALLLLTLTPAKAPTLTETLLPTRPPLPLLWSQRWLPREDAQPSSHSRSKYPDQIHLLVNKVFADFKRVSLVAERS